MLFHSWLQNVRSALTQTRAQRRRPGSPRVASRRPHLEALEERCVPAQYAVTDLGSLGGGYSIARDINQVGQVVGYSGTTDGVNHAFLWSDRNDGTMIDLGTLGGGYSDALGINDLGQVVGISDLPDGTYDAFLITPQNGVWFRDSNNDGRNDLMVDLMDAQRGSSGSTAYDVNNAGQVVGCYTVVSDWSDGSSNQACLWDPASGMTKLGVPLGFTDSTAVGINQAGQIAGSASYYDPDYGWRSSSFLWDAAHGMTPLGAGPYETDSEAMGINDAGQVVGVQWNVSMGESTHAFVWTPDAPNGLAGNFADLGVLPDAIDSTATAINNVGQIVGSSTRTDGASGLYPHAFFLDAAGGMIDLQNQLLPGYDATLESAQAINDGGSIAVNGSNGTAYLLIPYSPSTPTISITDAPAVTEGNTGDHAATFTVTLSAPSTQTVTVDYATTNGTATGGSDYQAATGTLTFAPGETSKTITVQVIGDRLPEPNETFAVNLSAPTNATIADSQGVGTIADDEPRISISDVTKAEGRKGKSASFTFTVTLSAAYDQPVTMSFKTTDGTAKTSDQDYVAKTGTLTFAPGETTKTITIVVNGDSKKESDENFYLDLFGLSSNALFTKNRGVGTILNDD